MINYGPNLTIDRLAASFGLPTDIVAHTLADALRRLSGSKTAIYHVGSYEPFREEVADIRRKLLGGEQRLTLAGIAETLAVPTEFVSTYLIDQMAREGLAWAPPKAS
jgi:hypothetical protein